MRPILLVDFGSTYTKVTGVDLDEEVVLGTAASYTTIESDITIGLKKALLELEKEIGPQKWSLKLGCSSAAGGLKMVAVGLVPELTSKAAKTAALSAGAKVLRTYSYKLNEDELEEIQGLEPDILLLSGGTDGGNEAVVLHNARVIASSTASFPVIYAGNKSVVTEIKAIFDERPQDLIVTGNVMPTMETMATVEVKAVIGDLFLSRIIEAKGLSSAEAYLDNILMPTPTAVMNAGELLAKGTSSEPGFGDLMIVDMGGATTDIHSACEGYPEHGNTVLKGLQEPYVKRSVEGDLGARYSLRALIDTFGSEMMARQLGWSIEKLEEVVAMVEDKPDTIAEKGSPLNQLDDLSARVALTESARRHCGTIASHYTPFGEMFEQVGKDLTKVSTVIGTGGPVIHNHQPKALLSHVVFDHRDPVSLRPKAPDYYIDSHYIMAAMGLLATEEGDVALRIMKKEIKRL